jgi:hypothetical protein
MTAEATTYRGYEIRYVRDNTRPPTALWLPTVIHPTERGRSLPCRTVAGCKRIIDMIVAGKVAFQPREFAMRRFTDSPLFLLANLAVYAVSLAYLLGLI